MAPNEHRSGVYGAVTVTVIGEDVIDHFYERVSTRTEVSKHRLAAGVVVHERVFQSRLIATNPEKKLTSIKKDMNIET